jgi:GT2 family glycosyltransferase
VLFLNPDTILPPASLAALLEKLFAFPDAGVIAPQLIHRDGRIQLSCRRFPTHRDLFCELSGLSRLFPDSPDLNRWKMGEFDHRRAAEVDQPQGACLLARPEVLKQVGGWDERFPIFFSDVDWCRRVWENGWKIRFEPAVQIVHAQGVSVRQVRAAAIWSSHVSCWRYLRKHENNRREHWLNLIFGPLLLLAAGARIIPCLFSALITRLAPGNRAES